jgi:HAD superfamily phosphatase
LQAGDYLVLDAGGQQAYVRRDRLDTLRKVDGVVFDCDGVLVDIRESYNRAVSETVAYILERVTGCKAPENWVKDGLIYSFRKTGGFNNDWDTVYGILMFTLSSLPQAAQMRLKNQMKKIGWQQNPYERLATMRNTAEKEFQPSLCDGVLSKEMMKQMLEFAGSLDERGLASIDWNLVDKFGGNESFLDFYTTLTRFLHTPAEVGKSVIATVFEEFFGGAELFREDFGVEPRFNLGKGKIENEKLIIKPETLNRLKSLLGKDSLGIASGSRTRAARYVLGSLLERFNSQAVVFQEAMENSEREHLEKEGQKVNLKKPHPFSLLKAAEGFGNCDYVLYVGDSMEDMIIADKAAKTGKPFLFAGVYSFTGAEEFIRKSFLEAGCDMVIPSVNELPFVLESLGRQEK